MTWTHNICLECWTLRNPNQIPAMIKNAKTENCLNNKKEKGGNISRVIGGVQGTS